MFRLNIWRSVWFENQVCILVPIVTCYIQELYDVHCIICFVLVSWKDLMQMAMWQGCFILSVTYFSHYFMFFVIKVCSICIFRAKIPHLTCFHSWWDENISCVLVMVISWEKPLSIISLIGWTIIDNFLMINRLETGS